MKTMAMVRSVILVLSAAATIFGVLVMAGIFVPAHGEFPEYYRYIIGAVIALYGLYRFLISYYRGTGS
jgi:hypothetical protein